MDNVMPAFQELFRWVHVVAGILWIGLLYFLNWVNSAFAPTLDADTKKKVIPELLPRTLFWFRWGAAYTWLSGLVLLTLVFYHGQLVWQEPEAEHMSTMLAMVLAIAFLLVSTVIYDQLVKTVLKAPAASFFGGWILSGAVLYGFMAFGYGYRGYTIHLGSMFGTFMAFNVWMRIWPAQKKIITAIKNGEAPDGSLVALAGTRSKHNTYMSVPLVFTMLNQHNIMFAEWWKIWIMVLIGFVAVNLLYKKAKTVPGF